MCKCERKDFSLIDRRRFRHERGKLGDLAGAGGEKILTIMPPPVTTASSWTAFPTERPGIASSEETQSGADLMSAGWRIGIGRMIGGGSEVMMRSCGRIERLMSTGKELG